MEHSQNCESHKLAWYSSITKCKCKKITVLKIWTCPQFDWNRLVMGTISKCECKKVTHTKHVEGILDAGVTIPTTFGITPAITCGVTFLQLHLSVLTHVSKVTNTFGITCAITCEAAFCTTHVYQWSQPHYCCGATFLHLQLCQGCKVCVEFFALTLDYSDFFALRLGEGPHNNQFQSNCGHIHLLTGVRDTWYWLETRCFMFLTLVWVTKVVAGRYRPTSSVSTKGCCIQNVLKLKSKVIRKLGKYSGLLRSVGKISESLKTMIRLDIHLSTDIITMLYVDDIYIHHKNNLDFHK